MFYSDHNGNSRVKFILPFYRSANSLENCLDSLGVIAGANMALHRVSSL